jgi:RNA polymerase sigma factor (sigma-70 family)
LAQLGEVIGHLLQRARCHGRVAGAALCPQIGEDELRRGRERFQVGAQISLVESGAAGHHEDRWVFDQAAVLDPQLRADRVHVQLDIRQPHTHFETSQILHLPRLDMCPWQRDANGAEKFDARPVHHGTMTGNVDLVDADLVEAARRGDAACAGALLARHRAAMHAVAVSLLGWSPDAEDAVQDAMLTALQRIGELRDASAAGPWLKAITRNNARMRLRSPDRTEPASTDLDSWPSREPNAEDLLDQHAMRDWLWSALETLSEPLHITVLLRYFTDSSSYQQIAAICGVPVGTVRSRLNEARRRLTAALVSSARPSTTKPLRCQTAVATQPTTSSRRPPAASSHAPWRKLLPPTLS